ncbi:MAG: hypothetical protein Q9220_001319 [cf. Caloplaca sp. 1 TL-2023]
MDAGLKQTSLSYGRKRRANDTLDSEQPLSKRFNRLSLGRSLGVVDSSTFGSHAHPEQNSELFAPPPHNAPAATTVEDEYMQVDETKDKVYIHNLDAEIREIESNEDQPLFLPDIEKKLSKIPQSVLKGSYPPTTNTQMILYDVPSSLSVPKEQDNVRRAILDSRARSREKQAADQRLGQGSRPLDEHLGNSIGHDGGNNDNGIVGTGDMDIDENAMDIG